MQLLQSIPVSLWSLRTSPQCWTMACATGCHWRPVERVGDHDAPDFACDRLLRGQHEGLPHRAGTRGRPSRPPRRSCMQAARRGRPLESTSRWSATRSKPGVSCRPIHGRRMKAAARSETPPSPCAIHASVVADNPLVTCQMTVGSRANPSASGCRPCGPDLLDVSRPCRGPGHDLEPRCSRGINDLIRDLARCPADWCSSSRSPKL